MSIMKRADKRRFGNLQIELKNSFLLGKNEYPTSVPEVLKILNNYKPVWTNGTNPSTMNSNTRNSETHNAARNSNGPTNKFLEWNSVENVSTPKETVFKLWGNTPSSIYAKAQTSAICR